jgi:hypothetical protein
VHGKDGDLLLVQTISKCLLGALRRGRGSQHPVPLTNPSFLERALIAFYQLEAASQVTTTFLVVLLKSSSVILYYILK